MKENNVNGWGKAKKSFRKIGKRAEQGMGALGRWTQNYNSKHKTNNIAWYLQT